MQTEFNFPKNAFGYIAGAVPAKMVYSDVEPLNPVEGLWWVRQSPDPDIGIELYYYTGSEFKFFGSGIAQGNSVEIVMTDATNVVLDAQSVRKHYICTSNDDVTIEVNVVPFNAKKTYIVFVSQFGTGDVTLVAGTGVVLRHPEDTLPKPFSQYSTIALEQVSATEFLLVGKLGY